MNNFDSYDDTSFLQSHMKFVSSFVNIAEVINDDISFNHDINKDVAYQRKIYLKIKKGDLDYLMNSISSMRKETKNEEEDINEEIKKMENEMNWINNETNENLKEREKLIEERNKNYYTTTLSSTRDESSAYVNMNKKELMKRYKELKTKMKNFENDLLTKRKNCEEKYKKNQSIKLDNKMLYEKYKQKKLIYDQLTVDINEYKLKTNGKDIPHKKKSSSGWFSSIFK